MHRWYEFAPEALVAAGLTVFLVDETDAATSALKSGRAVALMGVAGVAWLAARIAAWRWVRPRAVRLLAFGLAALGVLAAVVLPAYDDDTVVEAFPAGVVVATALPSTSTTHATPTTALAPPMPTTAVPVTTAPASEATAPATGTPPAEPVRLRAGDFRGIDHRAEGVVAFYERSDGTFVVGLEDFDIQPGPDYDLYVVPGADREDRDGGTRLDDLRGNRGTQFYDVPAGLDLTSGAWTVLVWCERFAVPVANATPA